MGGGGVIVTGGDKFILSKPNPRRSASTVTGPRAGACTGTWADTNPGEFPPPEIGFGVETLLDRETGLALPLLLTIHP